MRVGARTMTALLVAGVFATGCGVEAKSGKHLAGVCDSVGRLLETRRSLDALDRKMLNANRVVTSADDLRKLSLTYRREAAAYAALETRAKRYVENVDAGESTAVIRRMWRQVAAALDARRIQTLYFADAFANPKRPVTRPGEFTALGHHAIVQRANAQYFRMDSVMNDGLTGLGLTQRRGVFVLDC